MADDPSGEPEHDDDTPHGGAGIGKPEPEQPAATPRIPADDPADHETGKRFMSALDGAALIVTVSEGDVTKNYAPGELVAKLAKTVSELLRDVGGGFTPMLYAALPGNSMRLYFGDPQPEEAQGRLPMDVVLGHAQRVAELIDLNEDDLFDSAVRLGAPAQRYAELAHLVENEGVVLEWKPRDDKPHKLSPRRASQQFERLSKEPPTSDRVLTINGVLYRVIAEPHEGRLGSLGIRLHDWSAKPPSRHRRGMKVLASYGARQVEEAIKNDGLIGEPVEARLIIRQPQPGTSIDPGRVELVVDKIASGPDEKSRLGMSFMTDEDDLTDLTE